MKLDSQMPGILEAKLPVFAVGLDVRSAREREGVGIGRAEQRLVWNVPGVSKSEDTKSAGRGPLEPQGRVSSPSARAHRPGESPKEGSVLFRRREVSRSLALTRNEGLSPPEVHRGTIHKLAGLQKHNKECLLYSLLPCLL